MRCIEVSLVLPVLLDQERLECIADDNSSKLIVGGETLEHTDWTGASPFA